MAHIHELIDYVVSVCVVHENNVLMIHHKTLDRWLPVGGHIELNEDPEEAVYREVKEESGLDIEIIGTRPEVECAGTKVLICPQFMDIHDIGTDGHRHIGLVYFARAKSPEIRLAEEEHHAIRWFSEADLDDPVYGISSSIRFYAKEALRTASSI